MLSVKTVEAAIGHGHNAGKLEAFNAQPSADTYSEVVSGCLSCHMRACPGPIERINKRLLETR